MAVLSKQQVIQIIQNAPQGTTPEGIVAALRQQGHQLEGYPSVSRTPEAPSPQLKDTGSFMGNVVNSAGNLIGGVASAIAHPIKTTEALGKVALGGVEKLIPGRQGAENEFDALTSYYKQRYGSVENFLKTAYQDPVGTAADASLLFGGAAGVLGKAGKLSEIGGLTRTAGVLQKAGEIVNPLNVPGEIGGALKQIPTVEKAVSGIQGLFKSPELRGTALKTEESTLRLTPSQKVKFAKKLKAVDNYLLDEVPAGGPEFRFDFVKQNYDDLEKIYQKFLTEGDGKNAIVQQSNLLQRLENLKLKYANTVDVFEVEKQIDSLAKLLDERYSERIPAFRINELKRSAFKKGYAENNEVLKDIGHILYKDLKQATEGLKIKYIDKVKKVEKGVDVGEFNMHYETVIDAKDLLQIASGRSQVSPLDRIAMEIIGGAGGASTGGMGGGAVGYLAGKATSEMLPLTAIKSLTAKGLSKLDKIKTQTGIKVKSITSKVPQVLKPTRGKTIMVGRVQRATESNNK